LWLDWRHVGLERRHVIFEKTKNEEARGVPLHERVVAALANLPHRKGEVFRRPDGLPYERPKPGDDSDKRFAAWLETPCPHRHRHEAWRTARRRRGQPAGEHRPTNPTFVRGGARARAQTIQDAYPRSSDRSGPCPTLRRAFYSARPAGVLISVKSLDLGRVFFCLLLAIRPQVRNAFLVGPMGLPRCSLVLRLASVFHVAAEASFLAGEFGFESVSFDFVFVFGEGHYGSGARHLVVPFWCVGFMRGPRWSISSMRDRS
jgi:hypothetical protein